MGDLFELRSGLATSVGPVPFVDPTEAAEFVLVTQPELPAAPTAGRGTHSLLHQAVCGLDGVQVLPTGMLQVDGGTFCPDGAIAAAGADGFGLGPGFEMLHQFLDRISAHAGSTAGFVGVRVALTGPVSLSLALRSGGVELSVATEVARAVVARRAAAVLGAVRAVLPSHAAVICLNEPGLVGAMHPTFPLTPTEVVDMLEPAVAALDRHPLAGRLLIGAHVPGRTDWETIVASGVSLISTPADANVTGWVATLADFLERGGRVAWGAVPVDQPLGTSEELLWRRLSGVWCELVAEGIDPLLLRQRSFVSPVDGLGHFGPSQAELALGLARSISVRVGRQAVAARLSLGA